MSNKFKYIPINSLCEGCLSADRKLTVINDERMKKFFREIFDSRNHIHELALCWECVAIVRRIIKYIDQVKHAHEFLIKYMLSQAKDLKSLSSLSTTKVDTLEIPSQQKTNADNDQSHLSFKIETVSPNSSRSATHNMDKTFNIFASDKDINKCSKDKDYDNIVTIKIERQDNDESKVEAFCVADDLGDDFEHVNPALSSKETKRLSDNFNESDDEPLDSKKTKKGTLKKKKGRPKKTDKNDVTIKEKKKKEVKKERSIKEKYGVVNNARIQKKLQQLNVPSGQLEMVILSQEELEEERQQTLKSAAFTRLEYRCYDCVIGFSHKSKLDNHLKKHDPAAGSLACGVCGVRCGHSRAALAAHLRRHRVRWVCVVCGGRWSRADVAADHAARAHGAPPPTHLCTMCGAVETTLGKLRRHLKSHAERQKCELCGKTFSDRTSLRTHLFIHKGEKEFTCPRCDKKFLFKKAMEIHLITHDQSSNLYCYDCDLNFKNKMSYYQHIKYNLKHIDPAKLKYACELCDKKFAKASRLHEHNLGVHLKITPFHCTIDDCDVSYSSRPALRTHVRMSHRDARSLRNHVCDKCGKAYSTKKVLEGHIRTHTGERPFKCVHCPSTFGYEAALYNHNKLVHLKIKNRRAGEQSNPVPPVPNNASAVPNNIPTVPDASTGWQHTLNIANEAQVNDDIS